jgi:hypothetical protein
MTDGERMTDNQRERALELLEGRRLATDASMWQAPSLTLVAQAFLLAILTDDDVGWTVASFVAGAGVLACLTAILALWLLHDREYDFGERVRVHAEELRLGNPNRTPKDRSKWHPLEWKGRDLWSIALAAFIVADVVALFVTR